MFNLWVRYAPVIKELPTIISICILFAQYLRVDPAAYDYTHVRHLNPEWLIFGYLNLMTLKYLKQASVWLCLVVMDTWGTKYYILHVRKNLFLKEFLLSYLSNICYGVLQVLTKLNESLVDHMYVGILDVKMMIESRYST